MRIVFKKAVCLLLSIFIVLSANITFAEEVKGDREKEFELMTDELMKELMEKYHVPGVTLSVVKDGKLFMKKGYGYGNLENKIPVNPDETLFGIGSVTKTFTATAALQLWEKGQLNLDDEVNKYLHDFKIEYYKENPIKIKHLLTHTAGFDEKILNIMSDDIDAPLTDLGEFLKKEMPKAVREPGKIMQYSNHGMTLMGHIVENVSKQSIDHYVEQEIFQKLGMKNSCYYMTRDLIGKASKGYLFSKGRYREMQPTVVITHPAGSILSTGSDMAKFLIAHLEYGEILKEETLRTMHQTHFTHGDSMLGNAYGFYEVMRAQNKVIEHGGNTPEFSSLVSFCPEKKLGFFIASNTNEGGTELREAFANIFYEHFLGKNSLERDVSNLKSIEMNVQEYLGEYEGVRIPKESPVKIVRALMGRVTVNKIDKGSISVKYQGEENIYTKSQGRLFKNEKDNSYLTFEKDSNGKVYLIMEKVPPLGLVTGMIGTFEKVDTGSLIIEDSKYNPFIAAVIYLLIMLIAFFRKNKKKYEGNAGRAKALMMITSMMVLAVSASFVWLSATLMGESLDIYGILIVIHILSFILLGLIITTTFFTTLAWKYKYWTPMYKVWHTLVNLSFLSMIIFMVYMNCFNIGYLI